MNLPWLIGLLIISFLTPTIVALPVVDDVGQNFTNSEQSTPPIRISLANKNVVLSAGNVIVVDRESDEILYEKDAYRPVSIASITKLVTALVVAEANPNWDQVITIQKNDIRTGGLSQVFVGEQIKLRDLFNVMLVASANEAAAALARVIDAENFSDRMNDMALTIGMTDSNFVEPTGLDPQNTASAHDVYLLLEKALSVPEIASAIKLESHEFGFLNSAAVRRVANTNMLFSSFLNQGEYEIIGGKTGTGSANDAGHCLALAIKKGEADIIAITLGSQGAAQRWQDAKSLVDWVFLNYSWEY